MAFWAKLPTYGTQKRLERAATSLVGRLVQSGKRIVTAESLTAGMIAATLAKVPGASKTLWGGFICYDPHAKIDVLGVKPDTIANFGVVSPRTASEMAVGALRNANISIAVAVTGVAGPGRNDGDPPIGTVDMAVAIRGPDGSIRTECRRVRFTGDRERIRVLTTQAAIAYVNDCLDRS